MESIDTTYEAKLDAILAMLKRIAQAVEALPLSPPVRAVGQYNYDIKTGQVTQIPSVVGALDTSK